MAWHQVYTITKIQTDKDFLIEHLFTTLHLIIFTETTPPKPTWDRVGNAKPMFNVAGVGVTAGTKKYIDFGMQKIIFDNCELPYQLKFYIHPWIPNINLKFWENS